MFTNYIISCGEKFKNKEESFDNVFIEANKCNRNHIPDYITENFYEQIQAGDWNHFYDNLYLFDPKLLSNLIVH